MAHKYGLNVEGTISDKNILSLKIDLNEDLGQTKGGNTRIASTLGNKELEGFPEIKLGLNIYKVLPK